MPCSRFLETASLTLGLVGHEVVDLGGGSVVSTDLETLVGHVKDHCGKGDFWLAELSWQRISTIYDSQF
jgi:hypothetical protein